MAVLVRILLFSLFMIGAMSKPQGGLAGQSLAEDNCFTASGERIPDCLPKERIEPPIGSRKCCCIQGDQCPNPFVDQTPIVPSDNPFAENENDNEVECDDYCGIGTKSGGSSRPVPLQPPPDPFAAPETCPGSDAKACCYTDKEIDLLGDKCIPPPPPRLSQEPWDQSCTSPGGNDNPFGEQKKTCGQRTFQEFNVAKGVAHPYEFPWTCTIIDENDKIVGLCAVVPEKFDNDISEGTRKVLTIASKLHEGTKPFNAGKLVDFSKLKVRFNHYDISGEAGKFNPDIEANNNVDVGIIDVIVEPNFPGPRNWDNIAVIVLEQTVKLVNIEYGVNAACYPGCQDMFKYQFSNGTGVRCWMAGYGYSPDNDKPIFKTVLRKIDIPIFPDNRKCKERIESAQRRRGEKPKFNVKPGEFCAGGEIGHDSCKGDGGAPLVCEAKDGRWHVVGLVNQGIIGECGTETPGIYTDIYHYKDFIESVDTSTYPEVDEYDYVDVDLGIKTGGSPS